VGYWVFVYQKTTGRSGPMYDRILLTVRVSEQIIFVGFVR